MGLMRFSDRVIETKVPREIFDRFVEAFGSIALFAMCEFDEIPEPVNCLLVHGMYSDHPYSLVIIPES